MTTPTTAVIDDRMRSSENIKRKRGLLEADQGTMEPRKRRRRMSMCEAQFQSYFLKRRTEKMVRFAPVTTTMTYQSFSQDASNIWYSDMDYDRFADECRYTLDLLDTVGGKFAKLDPALREHLSIRGIEHQIFPDILKLKKSNQRKLVRMILYQQGLFKATGKTSPGRLRAISQMFSKEATEWAIEFGSPKEPETQQKKNSKLALA